MNFKDFPWLSTLDVTNSALEMSKSAWKEMHESMLGPDFMKNSALEMSKSAWKEMHESMLGPDFMKNSALEMSKSAWKEMHESMLGPDFIKNSAFEMSKSTWKEMHESVLGFSYDHLDELTRRAGRISSSIVPAMNLPDSFESLTQNPDTFKEQIQNISALENTESENEYIEISKEDLDTILESVDPDTAKQILEERQDKNETDTFRYKIKVKFCITSFKQLLSEIQKILTVTIALLIIVPIPNQATFVTCFSTIASIIQAIEILVKIFRPNDKNDNQSE